MRVQIFFGWIILICSVNAVSQDYLVALKTSETLESFLNYDKRYPVARRLKNFIKKSFNIGTFNGFSGTFSQQDLERLHRCPMVDEITPDINVTAFDLSEQANSPRHLSRLSLFDYGNEDRNSYFYDEGATGVNVNVYIVDSGIEVDHPEFESRAFAGKDFTGEGSGDTNGHGTHVAGIIGSKTYGVAKDVNLIEVKCLDEMGHGSLSSILGAIEFSVNHSRHSRKPGVVNLSLGAMRNSVLNKVIESASNAGLVIVAAAGNSNVDACATSPASARSAITVGAIDDSTNTIAEFSNWGPCVDVFAPGMVVSSVNIYRKRDPQALSGTSMSAPIVSGLVANLLSAGASPASVKSLILSTAHQGRITQASLQRKNQTPNLVVYNGLDPEEIETDSDTDE
ncbi:Subtilase family protein [Clavispora lusitaniae]|uniref:Subtilase-type proteinase n=1 Tax=Clavispora lusitaniae (strain ATCC 42720) TaxID=306902 RepID=C4Y675_CLAL4|nr:uncharacterized protein CLUG_03659 [Clavispora lusitaniae ATCC 42720]EEQ39531.1 hypothetical protein CLUG_03659 [Clavispora lusitaniae ATCC 42720]KAF7582503.1 Subtilase family protein [Clavispora lusitaniae]